MDLSERILDANLNRAREALRVLEDYARLGLEDATLSATAKTLRHGLADAVRKAKLTGLISARDIVGDVGCELAGEHEYQRACLADVVIASGKRLTEALRVVEEVGKIKSPEFGAAVERMRYAAYDLEKRLVMRINPGKRFDSVRLYVLITESLCGADWLTTAESALSGGADVLQLREKGLSDRELLERAKRLTCLCHERGAWCVVNDRPDIAMLAGADGVHVGQSDLSAADARRVVGKDRLVGVSTHSVIQFREALAMEPDYVAVGPMFATLTKSVDQIAGSGLWSAVHGETSLPLVAIGGINAGNVAELLGLGCRCICVCQAVVGAADPEAVARHLRGLIAQ